MKMFDMLLVGGCFFLAGIMYTNERVRQLPQPTKPKLDFHRRFAFSVN